MSSTVAQVPGIDSVPISAEFETRSLIIGSVQLGKTSKIIEKALAALKNGYVPIILLNNYNMDIIQFKSRFKWQQKSLNESKKNRIVVSDSVPKLTYSCNNNIILSLCNYSRVSKIYDYIVFNLKKYKFYVIIDESDIFNSDCEKEQEDLNRVSVELKKLLNIVPGYLGITATAHSHIFVNEHYELLNGGVTFLNKTDDYISYGHEKFEVEAIDSLYLSKSGSTWIPEQEELFVDILKSCYEERHHNGFSVTLVNVTLYRLNHAYIKDIVTGAFPDSIVILVNEGSAKIYSNFIRDTSKSSSVISIKNSTGTGVTSYVIKNNFNCIQKVLSYLQKNRKIFSLGTSNNSNNNVMVTIITCKQTGRGISVRSEVQNFSDIKDIIFANSIIYDCGSKKSSDELIQNSLRISGKFPGHEKLKNMRLKLYTTETIDADISEQLQWNEDIRRNIEDSKATGDLTVPVQLLVTPLDYKPSRKPFSATRGRFYCAKILDNYWCTKDKINEEMISESNVEDIDSDFMRWSKKSNNTGISKFIKSINVSTKYTYEELEALITRETSINAKSFISNSMKARKNHGNGILLVTDSDSMYSFNPLYYEVYKKYFGTTEAVAATETEAVINSNEQ